MRTRQASVAVLAAGVVGLTLVVGPACSRVERQNVDGVDCVVVKSPIGQPRHVDCDWPAEDSDGSEEPRDPQ